MNAMKNSYENLLSIILFIISLVTLFFTGTISIFIYDHFRITLNTYGLLLNTLQKGSVIMGLLSILLNFIFYFKSKNIKYLLAALIFSLVAILVFLYQAYYGFSM